MKRRFFACILVIVLLCSLLAGCTGKEERVAAFPNVFDDILSSAKCYLVWDSNSPDEYSLCTTTKYVTLESGNAVTSLEGLLNVLSEADCYTFGRKINEKLPTAVRQSEDEINSNIETGNKILTAIRENCGLIVYALDKVPEAENGTLKIGSVKYTLYLAKDYETVDASGEFKQQNRWVLADADGDMIVVGGGTYKGIIDSWWDMQKTVFKAPDLLIKYGSDAVKLEVKPE